MVGSGSQATVVESYVGSRAGAYFTNAVTEIIAGDHAIVDHYKLQRESERAFHVASLQVDQDRDSSAVSSHSISLGGVLIRNTIKAVMNGEGGELHFKRPVCRPRDRQHVDNHTSIDHARPHCTSRELYKGILDDHSTGVFNGRIVVRKDAQKTNATPDQQKSPAVH